MSIEPERPEHSEETEERRTLAYEGRWVGTWWAPLLVAFGTLIWCFAIWWLIGDRPRLWQYGTVPYVPGSTIFTVQRVPSRLIVPDQVVLPERLPGQGATSETR